MIRRGFSRGYGGFSLTQVPDFKDEETKGFYFKMKEIIDAFNRSDEKSNNYILC